MSYLPHRQGGALDCHNNSPTYYVNDISTGQKLATVVKRLVTHFITTITLLKKALLGRGKNVTNFQDVIISCKLQKPMFQKRLCFSFLLSFFKKCSTSLAVYWH